MLKGKQLWFLDSRAARMLPDSWFIRWKYRLLMGHRLDLRHPSAYSEKLQWMKLNDRNPLYVEMVDKASAKEHAAAVLGAEHVIPTLGVWDRAEDIDFRSLPGKFVLKCTHDSGSCIICDGSIDIAGIRQRLAKALSSNYFWGNREWPYKGVKPRVIAEPFVVDTETGQLLDYKFFCFDGKPSLMFIASGRASGDTRFDFYDMEFRHLPFTNGHPCADVPPEKPEGFEQMKDMAAALSQGLRHVRIDFYQADGVIYFGEYTFFHWSGFKPFEPEEWDKEIGKLLNL